MLVWKEGRAAGAALEVPGFILVRNSVPHQPIPHEDELVVVAAEQRAVDRRKQHRAVELDRDEGFAAVFAGLVPARADFATLIGDDLVRHALGLRDEVSPMSPWMVSRKPLILPPSVLVNLPMIIVGLLALRGRHNGASMRPVTARSFASGRARS
jgi:hypothetical protein